MTIGGFFSTPQMIPDSPPPSWPSEPCHPPPRQTTNPNPFNHIHPNKASLRQLSVNTRTSAAHCRQISMKSEKQIQTSRANGARSKGPVTPQGKKNSSMNSTRHGLLASTVVLEEEREDRFFALHQELMDEFQPRTATETALVETMIVARWRLLRVWGMQKTALDRDMALQDPNVGPAPV